MEYYIRQTDPYYLFHDHISTQVKLMMIVAPLERVKTILQVQYSHPAISPSELFPNAKSVFSHIYSKQGILGFWRGNFLPLLFFPPAKLIGQHLQQFTQNLNIFDQSSHPTLSKFEKVLLSNPVIWTWGLFLYPVYTLKTHMNLELQDRKDFKSHASYFSSLSKLKPSQLYSGFFFTLYLPYALSQLIEDKVKAQISSEVIRSSWVFAISMTATGLLIKLLTYPFTTVQFRLMSQNLSATPKFSTPGQCLTQIMKTEGYRGLYKGFSIDFISTLLKLLYISYTHSYF